MRIATEATTMAGSGRLLRFLFVIYSLLEWTEFPTSDLENKRESNWDFFAFVQMSPAAFCKAKNPRECYFPPNMTALTIHGIWPTNHIYRGWPEYCTPSSKPFSENAIQTLVPRLVQEWTNVYPQDGNLFKFWKHEWEKHGTCVTGIPSMSNEHDYFATALSLFEGRYNYLRVLEHYSIKPSNATTYSAEQFNKAFLGTYGVKPVLRCESIINHGIREQYLFEIWLCLQKDFQVMECPDFFFKSKACNKMKSIYFVSPSTM